MYKHKEYIILALLLLFSLFLRVPALTQPLGPDQGIMSVIGQGLLEGEIPYKDNWEMASPAIFFTYALIYKIFGSNMMAVPVADMVAALLGTFLIYILGKKLYGGSTGLLSALLYTLFSNGVSIGMNSTGELTAGTFWYIAQRESFVSPLTVMGMIFVLKGMDDKRTIWFGLVGLLGGIYFLYKFPFLLIFIMQIVFLNDLKDLKYQISQLDFFKKNGFAILVFVAVLIPVVWFFVAKGAFQDMIDATFTYVYAIYGEMHVSYSGIIKSCFIKTIKIARESFILWIFALVSAVYILANERNQKNLLVVCWAVVSFTIVVSHREFFGYHYLIMFPPLSILTAYGMQKIFKQFSMPKLHMLKDVRLLVILFAIIANLVIYASLNYKHYTRFLKYYTDRKPIQWYYGHFSAYPKHEYSFPADYLVSNFINDNAERTDQLFVLGGIESVIHVLTGLKSPSRFVYSWFLFTTERSQAEIAGRYRKELLNDLKTKTPKFIVSIESMDAYSRYSEFYYFIESKYKFVKAFPDNRFLYVLRSFPPVVKN